jgi:hypothetical protein
MYLQRLRNAHAARNIDPDLIGRVMASVIRDPLQDAVGRSVGRPETAAPI